MATFEDLQLDWSALCQECTDCWTEADLQLAAELGKTLLERNKELETALKHHQNVIDDQAQEIEYLTKQTVALKEVNDSRLRIYEQLEVSIQDLERANHRLALDHSNDKKQIKSLTGTVELLESKSEELQKNVDELNNQLDIYRRRAERQNDFKEKLSQNNDAKIEKEVKCQAESLPPILKAKESPEVIESYKDEEILRISNELTESRLLHVKDDRRIVELEEQLASMVQENNKLQDKFRNIGQNEDMMKSMHEEFAILEEVRQGQLCGRCLRNIEQATDDMSSIMDAEEDDDRSVISSLANEPPHKLVQIQERDSQLWSNSNSNENPYRDLVEKYEALLEVQRSQGNIIKKPKQYSLNASCSQSNSAPLSLQEELQMSGDFSQFNIKDTDEESANAIMRKSDASNRKNFTRTPDFSEAETSSSGYSDETSNKATQTDRERPGSFLCTIADGDDYRFSIYDDGGPIETRFRNRPEYRELFKEIFTILKKAAENKDDGEKLPLLDDNPVVSKVPPVTPATEDIPGDFTDDTQSVVSSAISERSVPMSDVAPPMNRIKEKEVILQLAKNDRKKEIERLSRKEKESKEQQQQQQQPTSSSNDAQPQKLLTPFVRQPLEFMAVSPQFRKKSSRHRRKPSQERQSGTESPVVPTPPKIYYQRGAGSKRRRDHRPLEPSPLLKSPNAAGNPEWNGTSMQFYNRSLNSPTPSQQNCDKVTTTTYQKWNPETDSWVVKQSTASQDLHKLRRLEMSYAEVLRNADKNKGRRRRHQ